MEMMLFLKLVLSGTGSMNKIQAFIKDDLSDILKKIARVHYKSAKKHLENYYISNDPSRELMAAICDLENSYNFNKAALKHHLPFEIVNIVFNGLVLKINKDLKTHKKCCQISILISICYKIFNDTNLIKKYTDQALEHFNEYIKLKEKYFLNEDSLARYNEINSGVPSSFSLSESLDELHKKSEEMDKLIRQIKG